ncbi:flagellar protein FliT [Romboutsia sp.]|uniref:flagellar protein FliT n=1 Tax=Romboutsia sp. TaxID=1965302 RepID=UPI003F329D86
MAEYEKNYKEISLGIIKAIENENIDILEELFNKRQLILEQERNSETFKKKLIDDGVLDIDKEIKTLLSNNLEKVKQEIKEYKLSKNASNLYINFNKDKLNIFNEKV